MVNVFQSIRWTLISTVIRRAMVFGLFFYLTRELSGVDIGLFGVYTRLLGIFTLVSLLSLDYLYIVDKENSKKIFATMTVTGLLLSVVFIVLLYCFAPLLAKLYNEPVLYRLIRWTAPILLVHVIRRVLKTAIKREFRFPLLSVIETANVTFYCMATVFFITIYPSVITLLICFFTGDLLEIGLILWHTRRNWMHRELIPGGFRALGGILRVHRIFLTNLTVT
ncbi:MAG: oligosaccharide flippase family protein, partial [Candidatus Cloacimonetes bacterium]|nr:oligosaccharide flippase family protein [Candidatus Cloacimonadota bacterium]